MKNNWIKKFEDKLIIPIEEGACWSWKGRPNRFRYRHFSINGKSKYIHRISYELYVGKIPKGLVIDHLCRNPECSNPKHLEAVTQATNIIRGIGTPALNSKKTHCPKGHEYTKENTYSIGNGVRKFTKEKRIQRVCRKCNQQWHRNYYLKSKPKQL